MKKLTSLADSRSKVRSFPPNVQDDVGYALYLAQLGEMSVKAKPLRDLGSGVMEIAAHDASGTYRAVYTVSIGELDLRDSCLSEEVQGGNRDAKVGHRPGAAAAPTVT